MLCMRRRLRAIGVRSAVQDCRCCKLLSLLVAAAGQTRKESVTCTMPFDAAFQTSTEIPPVSFQHLLHRCESAASPSPHTAGGEPKECRRNSDLFSLAGPVPASHAQKQRVAAEAER